MASSHKFCCELVVSDSEHWRHMALRDVLSPFPKSEGRDEFYDQYSLGEVTTAASTSNLFSSSRVVVARGVQEHSQDIDVLCSYLDNPNPDTVLVLEWAKKSAPKDLIDAVEKAGGRVTTVSPPRFKSDCDAVAASVLKSSPVRLSNEARKVVLDHLGQDVASLAPLLDRLQSAWGSSNTITPEMLDGYLGEKGEILPWCLDDAIDANSPRDALLVLDRLLGSSRHPLAVLKMLSNRFTNAFEFACAGEAAPGFSKLPPPAQRSAKKLARRGVEVLSSNLSLLAEAKGDLTGNSSWSSRLVLEVLTARLATQSTSKALASRR